MEELIVILIANTILATIFWWVHKKFEYSGTRWVLVIFTLLLPFIGIIYFIILSIQRMLRKKST